MKLAYRPKGRRALLPAKSSLVGGSKFEILLGSSEQILSFTTGGLGLAALAP